MCNGLLAEDFLVSHTCCYFEVLDLCSLDAVSRRISVGYATTDAWRVAASYAGLSLVGVDKSSIKALCSAVRKACRNFGPGYSPGMSLMLSDSSALELTKAADHMERMRSMHLGAGGTNAVTFIHTFWFDEEDVDLFLEDPDMGAQGVSSHPTTLTIGNETFELSLTWRGKTMWLTVNSTQEQPAGHTFNPFVIRMRAVANSLCMWKNFQVCRPYGVQRGDGLCCMLELPEALADQMEDGIICAGLAHDVKPLQEPCGGKILFGETAQALQLDAPGWKTALLRD